MSKNLAVTIFRNGDTIPEAKSNEEWLQMSLEEKPAWCYPDNDSLNDEKFGKLYNWFAVTDARGLAPLGWHIPDSVEMNTLIINLGGEKSAGLKLKSRSGWNGNDGNNSSGFSAPPAAARDIGGMFYYIGVYAYFWSTTPRVLPRGLYSAWALHLSSDRNAKIVSMYTCSGASVRCIKD